MISIKSLSLKCANIFIVTQNSLRISIALNKIQKFGMRIEYFVFVCSLCIHISTKCLANLKPINETGIQFIHTHAPSRGGIRQALNGNISVNHINSQFSTFNFNAAQVWLGMVRISIRINCLLISFCLLLFNFYYCGITQLKWRRSSNEIA